MKEFSGEIHQTDDDATAGLDWDGVSITFPNVCCRCGRKFVNGDTYSVRSRLMGSEFRTVAWHSTCPPVDDYNDEAWCR